MAVSKEVYKNRKENRLCTRCGEKAELNRTLCLYHLQKANKNQKAVNDRRRNKGLCPLCGQNLLNNRKTCNQCLEKHVSKCREDVWIPHKDRTKLGLCLDCGKEKLKPSLFCNKCAKKRINNQSNVRSQKIINGLCGVCGERLLVKDKKRCIICIHRHNKWYATSITRLKNIAENKSLKHQVVEHYGGKCNCCGETEKTFLAIDHINGGGNIHRKGIKKASSYAFYKWIIKQSFPDEFQILCHNCNMSKYLLGGICAHKQKE